MELLKWWNNQVLWGPPMLLFMLGCGLYLTWMTRGILFRKWGTVIRSTAGSLFKSGKKGKEKGEITPFQAVSTALAGTVGTGNIVGVSVAIAQGGPGAVFWMWMSALVGMMTKFSEVTLAVDYREKNRHGEWSGGPMYYIKKGIGSKGLSICFCVFGALCSFGIGNMVQTNSMAGSLQHMFGVPNWITGMIVSIVAALVLIGGMERISRFTSFLVPFMALFYMVGAGVVLFLQREEIPQAFAMIFSQAFSMKSATGGVMGAGIAQAIRIGVSRGIFTNEAGMGSAPIAHASAKTDHPVKQGMWGAFEVFFDTIVMCSVTALVLLSSPVMYRQGNEGQLIQIVFSQAFQGGQYIVPIGLVLFAFATVIAWYYYGSKCMEYLVGESGVSFYRGVYVILIFMGCVMEISTVWEFADFFNGLMAIPNLIALFILAPRVKQLTKDFFDKNH